MANKQISDFTAVDPLVGTDILHLQRGGADRQITGEDLKTSITSTGSNVGTGDGVLFGKVADDFQFKSFKAGPGVTIVASANELLFSAPAVSGPTVAAKTADTTRNSTSTLAVDPDLTVAVAANKTYIVELVVHHDTSSITPDFKFKFDVPASANLTLDILVANINTGPVVNRVVEETTTLTYAVNTASIAYTNSMRGILITGGTSGTLDFTWSQQTSDAADTTVKKGSWLRLTEVG